MPCSLNHAAWVLDADGGATSASWSSATSHVMSWLPGDSVGSPPRLWAR